MSRYTFIVGLSALALTAGPAFAQSTAPGTVVPHHMAKASAAKKMPMTAHASPDMSADSLNAKELASIEGSVAAPAMAPKPAAKP
jgi:hypothetical protein